MTPAIPTNVHIILYEVKPADAPNFGNGALHPVMSTYALAREAEWAGRQFALQLKTADQEGIGTAIELRHKHPAMIGQTITIEARCISWDGRKLTCSILAKVGDTIIAEGSTGQAIISKTKLVELFKA